MAFISNNNTALYRGGSGLAGALETGARAKVAARACWICGNDARGKFCPPCSADVHDARTSWAQKQRRLAKQKT